MSTALLRASTDEEASTKIAAAVFIQNSFNSFQLSVNAIDFDSKVKVALI